MKEQMFSGSGEETFQGEAFLDANSLTSKQAADMTTYRPPAVAGQFYPDDPGELHRMVSALLECVPGEHTPPKALIAPHAGYIYSGPIAATAYACLSPVHDRVQRVILLGPAHRVYLRGMALSHYDAFSTPLGAIEVDHELITRVTGLPMVELQEEAHRLEHSLEVQLPFLQTVLDDFTLLPLVVGDTPPEAVAEVLCSVWGGDETLIVVSSDLSHYLDYTTAVQTDRHTAAAIEAMRLEDIGPGDACGCMPMRGLLYEARRRHMQVETLDLRNSGDTAGSRDSVVGYGAYVIH